MSAEHRQQIAENLTSEGVFPPENVELHQWLGTPDGWGIAIMEADDVHAVNSALNMWRIAGGETAFFEKTMTAPAAPVEEILTSQAGLIDQIER